MRLAAALASGVAGALLVGVAAGVVRPRLLMVRSRGPGPQRSWMKQAGLTVTPQHFLVVSLGAGLGTLAVAWLLSGLWPVALAPAVVVGLLPRAYYSRVRWKRLVALRNAWPDGLRDLVASISAGMSLPRALETLAESGPAPLREAFARYPALSRAVGVAGALESIRDELADPTSDRVIEVMILAHDRGGAIVPVILSDLAHATTKDVWAVEQIEGEMLEQKINSRVVFVLPWVVLVAMTARPGPFREFYASPSGAVVVGLGGALSLIGMTVASRLSREPDEPRVLTGPVEP